MSNNKYKNRSNPFAAKRQKVNKVDNSASQTELPPEFKSHTTRNRIVIAAVLLAAAGLVLSMIYPYLANSGQATDFVPATLKTETQVTISYSPRYILVGESLNRADTDYYVLYASSEDVSEIAQAYAGTTPIYIVDIKNPLNTSITADVSNGKDLPTNVSEIKVKDGASLLRVTDGVAKAYYQGKSNVISNLK